MVAVGIFERGVSDGLSKVVVVYVHDVPLYKVQTARQCAEFHPSSSMSGHSVSLETMSNMKYAEIECHQLP